MSELKNLADVLGDKLLKVGDYQRPYAWGEEQLNDLWEDVDLLGDLMHYTGTLVLQDMGNTETTRSGQALTVFEVVDGQQRLTTCVILLNSLMKTLRALGSDDALEAAGELRSLLIVNIGGVKTPRLQLGRDLRTFFHRSILKGETQETDTLQLGEQRLQFAAQYFDRKIAELASTPDQQENTNRLLELRKRVTYQLRFIVYAVDRADEVGTLFETVNGRGKDLTELERVKNYLIYLSRQLSAKQQDDIVSNINDSWAAVFKSLGPVRLKDDTLLRAHWLVTQDPNTRNWHGANSIKNKFPRADYVSGSSRLTGKSNHSQNSGSNDLYESLTAYIDTLRKSARYLSTVHNVSTDYAEFGEDAPSIREKTSALLRSGSVASFYPLILATRLKHPHNHHLYSQVISFCERYSARVWAIRGLRSNAGGSSIRWNAADLYRGKEPSSVLQNLEARLWELAPDAAVLACFEPDVQWYPRSNAHKFVLYEYELAKQRDGSDIPEYGALTAKGNKTTEHILPQTPEEGSQWWKDFSRAEHSRLVHGIGNLVLTRDNSRYGRRDYLDSSEGRQGKRGQLGRESAGDAWCYFNSANLARERELAASYQEWTPETIRDRAAHIGSWALSRWPASAGFSKVQALVDDDRVVEDEAPGIDEEI